MIMIQVVLGGITRLTGSGLSITDWDPIMGAIPPLNRQEWMNAFHLYQQTPQYRLMNTGYTLGDFKFIFFWEWFHRLWARLLGVVFMVPFIIFLVQKRFTRGMVKPMVILFLLGGLQGLVGWIMVKSGLTGEHVRVDHFKLAAHFITAMILLCYTLWFALMILIPAGERQPMPRLRRFTLITIVVLTLQLIYGGFMAGLHAALAASTWPSINGMAVPPRLFSSLAGITNDPVTVQFIHRGLAYLLVVLVFIWWRGARKADRNSMLNRWSWLPPGIVVLQVVLGIITVLRSKSHIPVDLAVSHQFVGMLLLEAMFFMLFLTSRARLAGPGTTL